MPASTQPLCSTAPPAANASQRCMQRAEQCARLQGAERGTELQQLAQLQGAEPGLSAQCSVPSPCISACSSPWCAASCSEHGSRTQHAMGAAGRVAYGAGDAEQRPRRAELLLAGSPRSQTIYLPKSPQIKSRHCLCNMATSPLGSGRTAGLWLRSVPCAEAQLGQTRAQGTHWLKIKRG